MIDGYIITYENPDTDGVCSAISYSIYLQKKYGKKYVPYFRGKIAQETAYVLKCCDIDAAVYRAFDENKKIIIVDTHNHLQLDYFSNYRNVIEIFDHHTEGDLEKFKNAKLDNREIGAVASIIGEKILSTNIMNKQIAIMIGSAIISNTLNFTAPATSMYDLQIFNEVKKYFDFTENYIAEMLAHRDKVIAKNTKEIIESDIKCFNINRKNIAISQLETMNSELILRRKDIFKHMMGIQKEKNMDYIIFNIVDMANKKSYVISSGESLKLSKGIFKNPNMKEVEVFNRVLQRKTDFIPQLYKISEGKTNEI